MTLIVGLVWIRELGWGVWGAGEGGNGAFLVGILG